MNLLEPQCEIFIAAHESMQKPKIFMIVENSARRLNGSKENVKEFIEGEIKA
jgi:hypothetical protein